MRCAASTPRSPPCRTLGYKYTFLPEGPDDRANTSGFNPYARDKFIADNPDVIARIGRATAKASIFLKENPQTGVRLFWDLYPDRAPKVRDEEALKKDLNVINSMLNEMLVYDLPVDFKWGQPEHCQLDLHAGKQPLENGLIDKLVDPNVFFDASQQDKRMWTLMSRQSSGRPRPRRRSDFGRTGEWPRLLSSFGTSRRV